jgi:hypothetical protein
MSERVGAWARLGVGQPPMSERVDAWARLGVGFFLGAAMEHAA